MKQLPFFHKAKSGGIKFSREKEKISLFLFVGYVFILIIFFVLISLRLFQLTITKGDYYRRVSNENRIREVTIEAKRGKITDRKGFVIAENLPADINKKSDRLFSVRKYYQGLSEGHLIGYRQIADQSDITNDLCQNKIKSGDKIGKKGVEKVFDCELRGRNGKKMIETDASGNFLRLITIIPPEDGKTIQLSIDSDLQAKAYELIKDKKASIIGLKPGSGEVIIFTASPSFDPQVFEDGLSYVETYLTDKNQPLFNRAAEATYPPGSIFKLVVSTAALEEKNADEQTLVEDTGKIKAGPLEFGNWYFLQYGKTEGMVDIVKAIQRSNDIFFYKIGEKVGPEKIKYWSEKFGLGKKNKIPLNQATGTLPSPFWKEEVLGEQWYLGDTYNLSIGQGYILTTPLQMAQVVSVFANNGNYCEPQLIKSAKPVCRKIGISKKTLDIVKEGMEKACATGGTGWPFFDFTVKTAEVKKIDVACKTGTAESGGARSSHAWFAAYAPAKNPEIILLVMIEEGGQGSDVAGPVAKEVMKAYFERTQ